MELSMSVEIERHCTTPIFSKYKHCPDCGDSLESVPTIKKVEELHPHILDPIKYVFKKASCFTGVVVSTRIYVRNKTMTSKYTTQSQSADQNSSRTTTTHTENIERAYNFLTLELDSGDVVGINIDAESESAQGISVGDAITIIEPMPLQITMPVPGSLAGTVNNRLADGFIVHKSDGSRKSRMNTSRAFDLNTSGFMGHMLSGFFTTLFVAFITFLVVWIGSNVSSVVHLFPFINTEEALASVPIIAGVCGLLAIMYSYKQAAKQAALRAAYEGVINAFLDITYDELGYDKRAPILADDDVFCQSCSARQPHGHKYCADCGAIQVTQPVDGTESVKNTTIKTKRLELMKQYQCETPEEKFDYHKFLGMTEHFSCFSKGQVYRVLDRSMYVSSSNETVTNTRTQTTQTREYYTLSNHKDSQVDIQSNTRVDIEGQVLVEDDDGDIFEIEVPSKILATLDNGDFLFVATQEIQHGKEEANAYRMASYNITKDVSIFPYDISDYEKSSILDNVLPILYFGFGVYMGYIFEEVYKVFYQLTQYPLPRTHYYIENIVLGVVCFLVPLFIHNMLGRRVAKDNRKRALKITKPIFTLLKKIKSDDAATVFAKYK